MVWCGGGVVVVWWRQGRFVESSYLRDEVLAEHLLLGEAGHLGRLGVPLREEGGERKFPGSFTRERGGTKGGGKGKGKGQHSLLVERVEREGGFSEGSGKVRGRFIVPR